MTKTTDLTEAFVIIRLTWGTVASTLVRTKVAKKVFVQPATGQKDVDYSTAPLLMAIFVDDIKARWGSIIELCSGAIVESSDDWWFGEPPAEGVKLTEQTIFVPKIGRIIITTDMDFQFEPGSYFDRYGE